MALTRFLTRTLPGMVLLCAASVHAQDYPASRAGCHRQIRDGAVR
jgi:hypothetical protein